MSAPARALVLACVASAGIAAADPAAPADACARHTLVSVPIMALSSNAIAVAAERSTTCRTSAAVVIGLRDGADGDFGSFQGGVAAELRMWLRPTQRGPYVAARIDVTLTKTWLEMPSRSLGTATELGEAALLGYRFVVGGRVELLPHIGLSLRQALAYRNVPAALRLTPVFGINLGWIFE